LLKKYLKKSIPFQNSVDFETDLGKIGQNPVFLINEAVPKLQFLEQLLTLGKNCISRKCLTYKE
jgi:hypothetical protein